MSVASLVAVSTLGAVLGLDTVSFPQAMLSRPIVAATLGGAFVGDAQIGLLVGATLELIALETLPVGASRYPEWGSAACVGGALAAAFPDSSAGALSVAVFSAIATAWVGGWTMVQLRRFNAYLASAHRAGLERGSARTVIGLQVAGLTADLGRGWLVTMLALLALHPLANAVVNLWSVDGRYSRATVVTVSAAVAGAALWKVFHATVGARRLFIGGLVVGLALLLFR
jgi:mannose/fructose/N-acetylgalactosamine-specific phosphotransferase system component IIC